MYNIKIKTITKILYLALIFFSLSVRGQHSEEETDKFSPNIIPPSPVAASLGNYGNIPVGMSTGSPNVNLEIYTLKENGISVPISLSYTSNGVQVDATSKQLGIDWNLIVGGVITRQVNSEDDFKTAWSTPDESRLCIPSDLSAIALSASPPQKDIFSYNAPGISGKFIMDGNSIRELNISDNKIEMLFIPNSNGENVRIFKITSIDGTEYYFGEESARESSSNVNYCGSSPSPNFSETAYLLTKIKTATGQEAYFKYISQQFTSTTYQQLGKTTVIGTALPTTANIGTPCATIERHTTFFVQSIELNDKKIIFEYVDLEANYIYQDSKQLKKIKIFSGVNSLFKSFEFNYDAILPNSSSQVVNDYTKTDRKRFFLKEVLENNSSELKSIKKYSFEYYNPEALPPKNSYSKDIFGYYNGRNNKNMLFNNLGPLSPLYTVFKNAITADRSPNPDVISSGMLKSITYPTKGKTEFTYEPNSVYIEKTFYPEIQTTPASAEASTNTANVCVPFTLPFSQTVTLYGEAEIVLNGEGICDENYPNWTPYCNVAVYKNNGGVKGDFVVLLNSQYKTLDVNIAQGDYFLCVSSNRPCVQIYGHIKYFTSEIEKRMVNDPVAGVRVSQTIDYDDNGNGNGNGNGNKTVKKYYYGNLDCRNCSSGEFAVANPNSVPNIDLFTNSAKQIYTMFSNSKIPLNSFDGPSLNYRSVIESYGSDFQNGGVIHYFKTRSDEPSIAFCDEYIRGTPYSNGFQGGNEYLTKTFRINGTGYTFLAEEESVFYHDESRDFAFDNYSGRLYQTITNPSQTTSITDYYYNFNVYQIRSQFHYLAKKISTVKDINGNNPIVTTTTYNYSNPNHLQLTSQLTENSSSEVLETKYLYAKDAEMASEPAISVLLAKNMVGIPLVTKIYKAGNKLSEKKTEYAYNTYTSNLPLPKYIYSNKGSGPIDPNQDKKLTFDMYDEKGNVLQYTLAGGKPVSIIWGYGKTLPIAKIENVPYLQISPFTGNLQNLSNADNDNCLTNTCKEQILRESLNALRAPFSQAMITTYTYNPLQGITSITDPKGISTYYEYDSFNRLKFVKNKDLYVLEKYCYNYKGEVIDCGDNTSSSVIIYKSAALSGPFTKNNCAAGGVGSSVTFSQSEGAATSEISQADADSKGLAKFSIDGQNYADTNSAVKCTFRSKAYSGPFTKSNCAAGGVGASVVYSQAAGLETSEISQADADSKGLARFNTDGQSYANTNPDVQCTFSSKDYSGSFTKSNCAAGGVGSSVTYSQAAGVEKSYSSQADADAKGLIRFNADGQYYANTNPDVKCTFSSKAYSGLFTRNNCASGGAPSSVAFSQAIGAVTSEISQADADSRGLTKFNTDGQAYANANAKCTFSSKAYSGSFTRNNCALGGVPSSVAFSQGIGAVTSETSQADADSRGLTKFNADGQAYANANAKCTFSSKAYSGSFTRNNCASGGVPSSVAFSQAIGAVTSEASQTDADSRGLTKFNTDGQAYANANAKCTFSSKAYSGSFTRNNCASGGVPSSVAFSQAIGAVTSETSQTDADSRGLTKFNADGQAYANANAKCTFSSKAYSGSFTRNNCAGGIASSVNFSQAIGAVLSEVSQADADSRGLTKFNTDGQANANANGTCLYYSAAKIGSFTRNNCSVGYQPGAPVVYTVAAGIFTSASSQADADNQAQNLVNSNGQNYANANGTCTPIVFNAEGEQNFDINRLTITLTASSVNHNGYTFNIEINYDNPINVNKYKTITATLLPGETYKVVSTSVLARTYAIIAF